jgi:hypothetical protein
MEIWKNIIGYEQYQVSNFGNVKITANEATRKERILKPLIHPRGYFRVALYKQNKSKFFFIHRLVAEHFIENPENKPQVNHKDGNKSNNNGWNLEWTTYRENMNHAVLNKLSACGERNGRAKLTQIQADEIKESTLSQRKLAEIYQVSQTSIKTIKQGKGWK